MSVADDRGVLCGAAEDDATWPGAFPRLGTGPTLRIWRCSTKSISRTERVRNVRDFVTDRLDAVRMIETVHADAPPSRLPGARPQDEEPTGRPSTPANRAGICASQGPKGRSAADEMQRDSHGA
jgi:hypothetical protein